MLIDSGRVAYDGDFVELRRRFCDRRHLTIETGAADPPRLKSVRFAGSDGNRHRFIFDAARTRFTALLQQASTQNAIHNVETHRSRIDDVIADID